MNRLIASMGGRIQRPGKLVLVALIYGVLLLSSVPMRECASQQLLRFVLGKSDGSWTTKLMYGDRVVGGIDPNAPAGLEMMVRGEDRFRGVRFAQKQRSGRRMSLGPCEVGPLSVRLEFARESEGLLRRTLIVTAHKPAKFAARWSLLVVPNASFSTFSHEEKSAVTCDTLGGGPEYPMMRGEAFPAAMARGSNYVVGVLADSPGNWENRCLVAVNPALRRLAVMSGDGHAPREVKIRYDAPNAYRGMIDGWQSLSAGETRRYDTWVFGGPALSHYDAQLTAHLALANAKGWNGSALEAILRNTAYLNVRRNLLRGASPEGRYIFISGIGYGWKQWVSDAFWQAAALEDSEKLAEAQRSIFLSRITYEDNAQYFLIWAALANRAGGKPDSELLRKAYKYLRSHERDGIYYPPSIAGATNKKNFKSYHDLLEYDDGDAPVCNQGFHCGALLAAKELGLPIKDAEIERAISAYRGMFYAQGGYFPTSIMQHNHVGQDALYGAALTYAVFGRKLLSDEEVLAHWRYSQRIGTPYGLRVISMADGSLLPGHSGVYQYGGSWFLNDAANHLMAELHGLPAGEADAALIKRIEAELAFAPAFNESISTLNGMPHGHQNYSWNSGYWWLRQQFRKRMGQGGTDPVAAEIDRRLGVFRNGANLFLEPGQATLRPQR